MAFVTVWRGVHDVQPARDTKKGDKQVRVATDKGEILNVSGPGIENIKRGDKVELSEPKQFGQSWYARLNAIDTTAHEQPKPAENPKPAVQETHHTNGNGASPASGKIPWADFESILRAGHAVAKEIEPDAVQWPPQGGSKDPMEVVVVDRSSARVALLQTILIAARDGRIEAPTPPEVDPWERGA